jgi:glycosyltransferase involved in cell wall biosynthesis
MRPGSRPMRVLVVATQEPWPLNHGGRLRLFHFVRHLARVAEVTLALPGAAQHATRLPAGLRVVTMCRQSHAPGSGHSNTPSSSWEHCSRAVAQARRHFGYNPAVDVWLRRHARPETFDVAFFSGAVLGVHVPSARVPVVWDCVDELVLYTLRDMQYGSWRRWPNALRRALLYALYERDITHHAAVTTFTSPLDAAYARRWAGAARVEVISNGVDLEYFHPSEAGSEPGTVAFVGSLEFPPNVDAIANFAARAWPQVYHRAAGRRLLVVGRRPVTAVKALASVPGVQLFADVPDVRPYLARASAVVVPTRLGGGVKNKILEACAVRRPVVASPRALAGLSARVGVEVLSAETSRAWAERLNRLLEHTDYARRLAQAGHDWVRRVHRWSVLGDRLVEILGSARAAGFSRRGSPERVRPRSAARASPDSIGACPGPAATERIPGFKGSGIQGGCRILAPTGLLTSAPEPGPAGRAPLPADCAACGAVTAWAPDR